MTRVKYTYDGSTNTETSSNFSAGEETAQDSVDASNQSDYVGKIVSSERSNAQNRRFIMEVI